MAVFGNGRRFVVMHPATWERGGLPADCFGRWAVLSERLPPGRVYLGQGDPAEIEAWLAKVEAVMNPLEQQRRDEDHRGWANRILAEQYAEVEAAAGQRIAMVEAAAGQRMEMAAMSPLTWRKMGDAGMATAFLGGLVVLSPWLPEGIVYTVPLEGGADWLWELVRTNLGGPGEADGGGAADADGGAAGAASGDPGDELADLRDPTDGA